MKGKMYSEKAQAYLHKTLLDAFFTNHKGIQTLRKENVVQDDREYIELLEKNAEWLFQKVKEFRIAERIVCLAFVFIFGYLQVNGDDVERGRRSRSRSGRRKTEYVNYLDL